MTLLQAHSAVPDPHGDRAYADARFVPLEGDVISKTRTVDRATDEPRSSTTLADDTRLTMEVAASARYAVDAFLIVDGDPQAAMSLTFTAPSDASGSWAPIAPETAGAAEAQLRPLPFGETATVGVTTEGVIIHPRGSLATGDTAGTLTLQWAPAITPAQPLTLRAGSWLLLTRTG
jgi:hypothetical protein